MPALPDALVSTLSRHVPPSNSRLETMAVVVLGPVCGRTVNPSHIAGRFPGTARMASNDRRLHRFFQFVRLDEDGRAKTSIGLLNLNKPFTLCLDRTDWRLGARDIDLPVPCVALAPGAHSDPAAGARRRRRQLHRTAHGADGALSQGLRLRIDRRPARPPARSLATSGLNSLSKTTSPLPSGGRKTSLSCLRMAALPPSRRRPRDGCALNRARPPQRPVRRHGRALCGHALLCRQTA